MSQQQQRNLRQLHFFVIKIKINLNLNKKTNVSDLELKGIYQYLINVFS